MSGRGWWYPLPSCGSSRDYFSFVPAAARKSRRAARAGRPPVVLRRSGSVGGAVEDVLGGVGHIRQIANVYAGSSRSLATDRVHPLHESYIGEDARANAGERAELEPGNGARIRGASRQTHPDHFAATVAHPGGAAKVRANLPLIAGVGEEPRQRRDELPRSAVPCVDLHAGSKSGIGNFHALGHLQAVAEGRRQTRYAGIVLGACERNGRKGDQSERCQGQRPGSGLDCVDCVFHDGPFFFRRFAFLVSVHCSGSFVPMNAFHSLQKKIGARITKIVTKVFGRGRWPEWGAMCESWKISRVVLPPFPPWSCKSFPCEPVTPT